MLSADFCRVRRRLSVFPLVVRDFAFCHSSYHTVFILVVTMMNFTTGANTSELLSLDRIRSQLIRLEDTIIFCEYASSLATGNRDQQH